MDVVIYHNPACGTSRNALALIRQAGIEPHVIEYLKTPPTRDMLRGLAKRGGVPVRGLLRRKAPAYEELGLDDPKLSEAEILDAIAAHPVLIECPLVVTPLGVRICRPAETVLKILPSRPGEVLDEDGARLRDEHGRAVRSA